MKIIDSFSGIGDAIYSRPFVRDLTAREEGGVWLKTPWPELFDDIPNLHFYKPKADYRTQTKNLARLPESTWSELPARYSQADIVKLGYNGEDLFRGNIINAYERRIPLTNVTRLDFDLPAWTKTRHLEKIEVTEKPLAVIRPVTIRKEWPAMARAPDARYISELAAELVQSGWHVVSIADCEPQTEWIVGPEPQAHQKFHNGELQPKELFSLIAQADLVVGGVGWVVPAALAARVPLFIVFGGQGQYNQISKVCDLRMDLSRVGYALPDKFCRCTESVHNCSKLISNLHEKFYEFVTTKCNQTKPTTMSSKMN